LTDPDGAGVWAVIPAAGRGTRMGASLPKQYLPVLGRPIMAHAIDRLCAAPEVRGVVVALAAGDLHYAALELACPERVVTVTGGEERCHSVRNALRFLAGRQPPDTWVLVHDAARPCVRPAEVSRLIAAARSDGVGAILALPARDTMKLGDDDLRIVRTVERRGLWHALTPQLFRLGALLAALEEAIAAGRVVTDEAQAMELAGARPLLVAGSPDNIKVTEPLDQSMAEHYLRIQLAEARCA
jgi:2-C-methyl-D-erythritol 4-phosphate cytidylyltransferase